MTLLIEMGGSAQGRLETWRNEIEPFFTALLRPSVDKAEVIGFNQQSIVLQPSSDRVPSLVAALDKLNFNGVPFVNDAIVAAVRQLGNQSGRRVLVVISDGVDRGKDGPQNMLDEKFTRPAQENGVTVYALTIKRPIATSAFLEGENRVALASLEHLSIQTGGRALAAGSAKDVRTFFEAIAAEQRFQYAVTYSSTAPANGKFRKLKVEVTRKDTKVRHSAGYQP